MRLIDAKQLTQYPYDLKLIEFLDDVPPYAILSHRWGDHEVSFKELVDTTIFTSEKTHMKEGWIKIKRAASIAINYGYAWLWCDTGCIDKSSSAELSESINSMFKWYQQSELCIAYLGDYPREKREFTDSVWFERAWTFQELVAPEKLIFFDCTWQRLGVKHELSEQIVRRTGIDAIVLHNPRNLTWFSIAEKMSWASGRTATKVEDIAYSLLGIFDVNMPMLYGEGKKAFLRLQEEIIKRSPDQSVLVWNSSSPRSLLAESPQDYAASSGFKMDPSTRKPFTLNNIGLEIKLTLRMVGFNTYTAPLGVYGLEGPASAAHLLLEIDGEGDELCRIGSMSMSSLQDDLLPLIQQTRNVTMLRTFIHRGRPSYNSLYGFRLGSDCLPLTVINKWDPRHIWDHGTWGRWDLSNVSQISPVEKVKQRAYRRRTWDEHGGMGDILHHEAPSQNPLFTYSENASTTIAMMTLVLDEKHRFLIQLSFDFDFNPCCHISRLTHDFPERFRGNFTAPAQDSRFIWPFTDHDWDEDLRSQTVKVGESTTFKHAWIAKSLRRQKFDQEIPFVITNPYRGLKVHFDYHDNETREWVFSVRSPNQNLDSIWKYVGDRFAIFDAEAKTQDRSPEIVFDF